MSGENEIMFYQMSEYGQQLLRDLSRGGYIYIGRTGSGLTNNFRKHCLQEGTIKAIEECAQFHDLPSRVLLEVIAVEGPRWVGFRRLEEVLTSEPMRVLKR